MGTAAVDAQLGELRELGLAGWLRELELPQVQVVGPWRAKAPTRKAILRNRFYVYGQAEELSSPIDWLADPHESRTWQYELHTLTWLKEALARHATGRDVETLARARDVVLDWAHAHLRFDGEESEFAWYDMAVGLRAPFIGYVIRACLAESMLGDEDAELLLAAAERHGASLADGSLYAAGNNHGLFQDEGLYLLARQLPTLPAATAWRELALNRMQTTLEATISLEEGAHLEHSPAYQLAILELLARLASNVSELPELSGLVARMRRTVAWQVTPGGRLAQLGDTDDLPAPSWARDASAQLRGANALHEAGQAFVREGDSYLAISAAHHGPAHKHADDTGFVLIENKTVVLGDAGRWGYYEGEADRLFARSAAAHNVLTVDGEDFAWRQSEPYGSGLKALHADDGRYEITLRNPLLAQQGVEHQRTLVYRPTEVLVVIDRVTAAEEHQYTRRFHFGPELEVTKIGPKSASVTGKGIKAMLIDEGSEAELSLVRGSEEPRQGWSYRGDRERSAVWTAELRSHCANAVFATVISLNGNPLRAEERIWL